MVLHLLFFATTLAAQAGNPTPPASAVVPPGTSRPAGTTRANHLEKSGWRAAGFGLAAAAGCAGCGVLPLAPLGVVCGSVVLPVCCGVSFPGSALFASVLGVWVFLVLAALTLPLVPLASAAGAALATLTVALLLAPRWFVVLFGAVPGAVLGLVAGLVGSGALVFLSAELFLEFLPVMPRQTGTALVVALVLVAAGATLVAPLASAGGAVVGAALHEALQQPTSVGPAGGSTPVDAVGP